MGIHSKYLQCTTGTKTFVVHIVIIRIVIIHIVILQTQTHSHTHIVVLQTHKVANHFLFFAAGFLRGMAFEPGVVVWTGLRCRDPLRSGSC
jgi:hypothetical protein